MAQGLTIGLDTEEPCGVGWPQLPAEGDRGQSLLKSPIPSSDFGLLELRKVVRVGTAGSFHSKDKTNDMEISPTPTLARGSHQFYDQPTFANGKGTGTSVALLLTSFRSRERVTLAMKDSAHFLGF